MIQNINELTLENIEKEIECIKTELKCSNFKLENMYVYVSFDKPIDGKRYSTVKEPMNNEGLNRIIHDLNKLNESSNTKFLAFGLEYQANNPLGGAKDLLILKKAA